ncbi:hypothetical protein AX289_28020 [Methylorubrum populi]|nr:hypothetical protein AX289_28020 [Methylorubrum populi]
MTSSRSDFLAVGPARVRRLSNNLPTTVLAIFRLTAAEVDPSRLDPVGDYVVGSSRVRHVAYGQTRIGVTGSHIRSHFGIDLTALPASCRDLSRIDLHRFTGAHLRLVDGLFAKRKTGESHRSDLEWFVDCGTVVGRRTSEFDVGPLVDLARTLQVRADSRVLLHRGAVYAPASAPLWVGGHENEWFTGGAYRPVLKIDPWEPLYRVWPTGDLARAAEWCRIRNGDQPSEAVGRVVLHVDLAEPASNVAALASYLGRCLRDCPDLDPSWMDARTVVDLHDVLNCEPIIAGEGRNGAERILHAFARVFESLPGDRSRFRSNEWTEMEDLHRRLVVDGLSQPRAAESSGFDGPSAAGGPRP